MAVGSPRVRLSLHPADLETLGSQVKRLTGELNRVGSIEVVADPAITAGGCKIDAEHGTMDQQFEAQLARIETELTSANDD